MRTLLRLSTILVFFFAADALRAEEAKTSVSFREMHAPDFIKFYQQLSGAKSLTISSNVIPHWRKRVSLQCGELPKTEVLSLMQGALAQQTGIILTTFGEKISVTFNEQFSKESILPVSQHPTAKKPDLR